MCDNVMDNADEVLKISEMKLTNGDGSGKRKDYLGKMTFYECAGKIF
jgi:hypothetical protein